MELRAAIPDSTLGWRSGRPSVRPITHLTGCLYWESFPEASVTPGPSGIWGRKKMNRSYHSPSRKVESGLVFLAPAGNVTPGALRSLAPGRIRASVALEDTLAASGPPVGPRAGASLNEGQAGRVSPSGRAYPVRVAHLPSGEARPEALGSLTASAKCCGAPSSL